MQAMQTHEKILTQGRARLLRVAPFYAQLIMSMGVTWRDDIKTMATDGRSLFCNPEWTAKLSIGQCAGVLAHEGEHVARFHHTRRKGRDAKQWNRACDYQINLRLLNDGFELPEGGLVDARFADMSSEQIYNALSEDDQSDSGQSEQGDSGQGDSGQSEQGDSDYQPGADDSDFGGILDAPLQEGESVQDIEAETVQRIKHAAQFARMKGKESGLAAQILADFAKPRVTWRDVLHQFFERVGESRQSWSRPNRRYVSRGLYLPGRERHGMGKLAIVIDVSGSINRDALNLFLGEIESAMGAVKPESIQLIECNTKVQRIRYFEGDETLPRDALSGGGTDMSPAFEAIDSDAVAVLCFTDLCFYRDPIAPNCPVIWAHWGDYPRAPAFGEIVKVES